MKTAFFLLALIVAGGSSGGGGGGSGGSGGSGAGGSAGSAGTGGSAGSAGADAESGVDACTVLGVAKANELLGLHLTAQESQPSNIEGSTCDLTAPPSTDLPIRPSDEVLLQLGKTLYALPKSSLLGTVSDIPGVGDSAYYGITSDKLDVDLIVLKGDKLAYPKITGHDPLDESKLPAFAKYIADAL